MRILFDHGAPKSLRRYLLERAIDSGAGKEWPETDIKEATLTQMLKQAGLKENYTEGRDGAD